MAILLACLASLFPIPTCRAGVGTSASQTAAQSTYDSISGWFNSSTAVQQNIANPITSNTSQMTTLDGSVSFDAQLACPSSSKFVEVAITSTAATGDIQISVSQDTDFDGVSDHTYFPSSALSGVCANGVIICNAGTWTNCSYYKWTADSFSYRVSLTSVSMTDLGGCYCINQSCGASYSNYSTVLQDIGGGVAGAIQTVDSRFSISNATVYGNNISYYGQDTSCNSNSTTSTILQSYYTNQDGSGLTNQSVTDSTQALQDTSSAYYSVQQAFNNSAGSGVYTMSCDIARNVVVSTGAYTVNGASTAAASICVDHYLYARVYEVVNADGTADYYMDILDTDPNGVAHYNCGAAGNGVGGWHNLAVETLPRQASSVYFCVTASGTGCTQAPTNCVSAVNTDFLVLTCGNTNAQYPTYTFTYDLQYQQDTILESVSDSCQTLSTDPNCTLQSEVVDGVTTYSNFMSTGNATSQTCQTFTGVDTHDLCRDYWTKTRTYFCYGTSNGTTYDFTNMQNRTESIAGTLTQSGLNVTYTDYLLDTTTGTFYNAQGSLVLPDTGTSQPCIDVCKVKVPVDDTSAALSGATSNYRTSTQSYDYYYRQCSGGQCPLDAAAGEVLVTDCACADDFADVISILSAIQEAGQDIICSSTGGW